MKLLNIYIFKTFKIVLKKSSIILVTKYILEIIQSKKKNENEKRGVRVGALYANSKKCDISLTDSISKWG